MPELTVEIGMMIFLLVGAFIAFSREWFPIEVTALGLLAVLVLAGFVNINESLSGLSNPAVVTIGALLVLSHALTKTGLLEVAAHRLSETVGNYKMLGVGITMLTASIASAFLSNTAVVAMFIPFVIHLSQRFHMSPSKLLLPLSYAAIAGGTLTLIGTSTTLIINSFMLTSGLKPLGMFEMARAGGILMVLSLAYIVIFARRLLPSRAGLSSLTRKYHMGTYLTELRVTGSSPLVGKSCLEIGMNRDYDIIVLSIIRNDIRLFENIRSTALQVDDTLIVRGTVDNIMRLRKEQEVSLLTDIKLSDAELSASDQVLAEGLVPPNSSLIGKTLRDIDFRRHFGAFVLAIRHHGETIRTKIAHIPLRQADTVLMLVTKERLKDLRRNDDLVIISESEAKLRRERNWWVTIIVIPLLVILVALGTMDILMGAVLAVLILLFVRAIDIQEVYRSVDWSILIMIAAFVPVGYAMSATGTDDFLAAGILRLSNLAPPDNAVILAMLLLFLGTTLLTQLVSNNATAIIVAPVAVSLANSLGANPRTFLIAVVFAASAAFLTPMAYQTNMMVYGPGSYRFSDYLRFGAFPNLLFWLLGTYLVAFMWPL